jgi:hypothetical protein
VRREVAGDDGGWRIEVEASQAELEQLCSREDIDFASRVSPCLPADGFVESTPAAAAASA